MGNESTIYYVTFIHPKHGEQHTHRDTKEEIVGWLSYMEYAHQITSVKVFKGGNYNHETHEYEGGELISVHVPKW